ncbi:helix-turn-helix protein [Paraburkholderia silvatlantica]|uniref:Helix-turn-helix protein n=1 Tax=Paraburkholderia silvatlantica TaxID=321895 RepID=A0A2V4TX03_9BURK|nr:helix-turn-helix domain-containing protein [Paraburkholderia silvatlantica]PYE23144.1 helix-turn-helix protein [Paraburkholderia silvatlantica]
MNARQKTLTAILNRIPGNDSASQRARLMAAMQETGHVTTHEAMRILDCYDPRPRIFELRGAGHAITTATRIEQTESGVPHRIGVYFLNASKGAA